MRAAIDRYIAPLVALSALLAYWPIALLVEDNYQAELLRAGQAAALTCVFVLFLMALGRALGSDVPDSARRFYLGLILWSAAAVAGALWRLIWRMAGGGPELDWMLTNDVVLWQLWAEIVGVFFMLSGPSMPVTSSPGAPHAADPSDISWRRIVVVALLCAGFAYVAVVARIGSAHIHELLEALHRS